MRCKGCNKRLDQYESKLIRDEDGKITFKDLCRKCEDISRSYKHYTQKEYQHEFTESVFEQMFSH